MHLGIQQAFRQFLFEFHSTRDYFECHEILEDVWKEIAPRQKDHELVGFILLATGMYHWRRGNKRGASRSLHKAYVILQKASNNQHAFLLLFNRERLLELLMISSKACDNGEIYQPISLPITDAELLSFIQAHPQQAERVADEIVHKHRLRDRSDVIRERERAKTQRHSSL